MELDEEEWGRRGGSEKEELAGCDEGGVTEVKSARGWADSDGECDAEFPVEFGCDDEFDDEHAPLLAGGRARSRVTKKGAVRRGERVYESDRLYEREAERGRTRDAWPQKKHRLGNHARGNARSPSPAQGKRLCTQILPHKVRVPLFFDM
jgi:hypothetical protein